MSRPKFFTLTKNSKGSTVKTLNNHNFAEAYLGVDASAKSDEDYISESIKVTLSQDKNGELKIHLTPLGIMAPTKVILNGRNTPQVLTTLNRGENA